MGRDRPPGAGADLGRIDTVADWARAFRDLTTWRPIVLAILRRHGLADCFACLKIEAGEVAGTHAVFVVGERLVVKVYGPFWRDDRGRELAVLRKLAGRGLSGGRVALPGLVAAGTLDGRVPGSGGRSWPYLVSSYVPGVPAARVWPELSREDRLGISRSLGAALGELHALSLDGLDQAVGPASEDSEASWDDRWLGFLARRASGAAERHRQWGSLPERLVAAIEGFIRDAGVPRTGWRPALLSCDVTAEHVLLAPDGDGWRVGGLIDFGDAMVGDPEYDFVVAHLSALGLDRAAFGAFLAGYGRAADEGLGRRLLAYMMLHVYPLFGPGVLGEEVRERVWAAAELRDVVGILWGS